MSESPVSPTGSPAPVPPAGSAAEGSLAAGVGLAWLIVIGGYLVILTLLATLATVLDWVPAGGYLLLAVAPVIAAVLLAVRQVNRGRRRTGKGILIGLVSIAAVTLLLVAACFGLLSNANFQ